MFIAMNRFTVDATRQEEFETRWKERESFLHEMEGFISFQLLKGDTRDDIITYISKACWQKRENFTGWVESEQFKKAHANIKPAPGLMKGHPVFEGYEVVLEK